MRTIFERAEKPELLDAGSFWLIQRFMHQLSEVRPRKKATPEEIVRTDEWIKLLLESRIEETASPLPSDEANRMYLIGLYGTAAGAVQNLSRAEILVGKAETKGIMYREEVRPLVQFLRFLNEVRKNVDGLSRQQLEQDLVNELAVMQQVAELQIDVGLSPECLQLAHLTAAASFTDNSNLRAWLLEEARFELVS